jgi:hypothetical protein
LVYSFFVYVIVGVVVCATDGFAHYTLGASFGRGMKGVTVTLWIKFHMEGVMLCVLLKGNF